MHFVSNGSFLTTKLCSIGLGQHSLTGLKYLIMYLLKVEHAIGYEKVTEIETTLAELSMKLQDESYSLPNVPRNERKKVCAIMYFGSLPDHRNISTHMCACVY